MRPEDGVSIKTARWNMTPSTLVQTHTNIWEKPAASIFRVGEQAELGKSGKERGKGRTRVNQQEGKEHQLFKELKGQSEWEKWSWLINI